jgi:inositol 1,4,5-triphosphate receptor type 1
VKHEHNQWAYLFFMLHLDETSTNDYTALELYVSRKVGPTKVSSMSSLSRRPQLAKEEYDFFPQDRALCLEHIVDHEEKKLEILERKMAFMVKRIKELVSVLILLCLRTCIDDEVDLCFILYTCKSCDY